MAKDQTKLPGTEGVTFPDIERAASAYTKIRDERMGLTEEEVKKKAKLEEVLLLHINDLPEIERDGVKVRVYNFDKASPPLVVELIQDNKVKVRQQANGQD